ncbi:MAG TPA: hypothetical protein PLZ52_04835 [Bacteroidales bacterium]|nr:hypothetical protein [Bacteroidales bacterium]HQL70139.1 hypothetical protein [Bacteroidales bacterium]
MSTRVFLILCSALISFVGVSKAAGNWHYSVTATDNPSIFSVLPFAPSGVVRLKTNIEWNEYRISGIIVAKYSNDTVKGVFVNEFGVKGFEFTVCNGNCSLEHILPYFDKWLIRKQFKKDLSFIFTIPANVECKSNKTNFELNSRSSYIYTCTDNKPIKASLMRKGKETATLTSENDSLFTMVSVTQHITYRFTLINENESAH